MTIAQTILQQLGGNKFIAMTGARDLAAGSNSLQFHFAKGANKANICRVTLETTDTYMVQFFNRRAFDVRNVGDVKRGIYADQLQELFTAETGLLTRL
jgi:hypothetical protein